MTKEEVQEIKNSIVDCMSLIDTEDIEGCVDRMISAIRQLAIQNKVSITADLCKLTSKITDKFDVRVQKLNSLVDYIETTLKYVGCAGCTGFDSTDTLENYINHIAEVEMLDEMDRCYIFTKIARDKHVTCYAGQIAARGLFKSIEW